MVFKRRRLNGGRFRRRFVRRTGRLRRLRKFVKRTVARMQEVKYSTTNAAFDIATNVPSFQAITPTFSQGAAKNQRVGNTIRYRWLTLRLNIYAIAAAASANSVATFRIVLVQLRLPLTTPNPQITDIFDTTSPYSTVKGTNVRVLWDKVISLQIFGQATNTNFLPVYNKKIRRKINNRVNFGATLDTVPRDVKDTYYLVVYPASTVVNDYVITVNYFNKISFYDT